MAGTFTNLLFHIVFSTKNRAAMIRQEIESRLHEFLGGIARDENAVALQIGGVANHVHLLVRLRADEPLAPLVRNLKSRSSAWVHGRFPGYSAFAWQEGYSAFSVSGSQRDAVDRYICGQHEHHQQTTFEDELRRILDANGVEYDERFVLD